MLFSSPTFFAFFVVYLTAHCVLPKQHRNFLIIVGSTVFYAWWNIHYAWLPFFLTFSAMLGAAWVEGEPKPASRKVRLGIVIATLLAPLIFYKYTDFLYADVFGPTMGWDGKLLGLPLPLGISFITFTLVAYIVDTSRGKYPREKNPIHMLSYVLFFPQLIAGPILRPGELIPQLKTPRRTTLRRARVPVAIFTCGLVKKLVFADQLAPLVDTVYAKETPLSAIEAIMAVTAFTVQIYCDFSGYTDMAIGLGLMLGVALPNNFARPYLATSFSELWRSWHMTLTRFLLDYVYTPISLKLHRIAIFRHFGKWNAFILATAIPVTFTFLISGIWHGAGWNFVLFGAMTGIAISINFAWRDARLPKPPKVLARVLTILTFMITLAVFRAESVPQSLEVLGAPFNGEWANAYDFLIANAFSVFLILLFAFVHQYDNLRRIKITARACQGEWVWLAIGVGWLLAIVLSQGSSNTFVYFDF